MNKAVCHHKLYESNRIHTRTISYSNVYCPKCEQWFEHELWHGVGNTVMTDINKSLGIIRKTLPDYDYDDHTFDEMRNKKTK